MRPSASGWDNFRQRKAGMAKDDEKQDSGFTLEEILAEYGVDVSRWGEDG